MKIQLRELLTEAVHSNHTHLDKRTPENNQNRIALANQIKTQRKIRNNSIGTDNIHKLHDNAARLISQSGKVILDKNQNSKQLNQNDSKKLYNNGQTTTKENLYKTAESFNNKIPVANK